VWGGGMWGLWAGGCGSLGGYGEGSEIKKKKITIYTSNLP